jgi:hypothetical protein
MLMESDKSLKDGEATQGPATKKYRPSNVAPPPEDEMRHSALGGKVTVQETSGVAAAEALGKLEPDPEEDPQKTAGSG